MDSIIELSKTNLPTLFIGIFMLMSAVVAMSTIIGKFSEVIGKPVSWIRKKNEDHQLLLTTAQNLNALQLKHEEDVKQSIRHDDIIKKELSKVSTTMTNISEKLDTMQRKNDESEIAKLKDWIAQAYRKYHEIGEWTEMDKESFNGLIADLESRGEHNTFVHDICQPESYTWKIIN